VAPEVIFEWGYALPEVALDLRADISSIDILQWAPKTPKLSHLF
jgi:hypothetical protein